MDWPRQCAVVIPCLNEAAAIGPLVAGARRHLPEVIVVDDGSTDNTAQLARAAGAEVISLSSTRGKGAALNAGLARARERGFAWALLMDGDGQHSAEDVPALLAAARCAGVSLVVGNRMGDPGAMPFSRRLANRFMSRVLSRLSGRELPDTQCGFRLVRLEGWSALELAAAHFEIDSEMLIAFLAAGHTVAFVPVRSIYKSSRSNIQPLRDALRWARWLWKARAAFARIQPRDEPALRASNTRGAPKEGGGHAKA